jgi:predicted transcriptional regulator
MSIKPKYAEAILNRTKKFEYRKTRCRYNIGTIIIYATHPVMQIVGEVKFKGIIEDTPNNVWKKTKANSGITKDFFDSYYADKSKAFAYVLGKPKKYPRAKSLSDFGITRAPQSFVYVNKYPV